MKLSRRSYTSHYQPFHVCLRSRDDICARHFCFKENPNKTTNNCPLSTLERLLLPQTATGGGRAGTALGACVHVSHREPGRDGRERYRERERETHTEIVRKTRPSPSPPLCSDPPCPVTQASSEPTSLPIRWTVSS